jgi:hypothetical protein
MFCSAERILYLENRSTVSLSELSYEVLERRRQTRFCGENEAKGTHHKSQYRYIIHINEAKGTHHKTENSIIFLHHHTKHKTRYSQAHLQHYNSLAKQHI